MNTQEYRIRLNTLFSRIESILSSCEKNDEIDVIKRLLASSIGESSEEEAKDKLDTIKLAIINLLKSTLTEFQIAFVEMEEPDSTDAELFKKHLLELKDLKQDLSSPNSETRRKISTLLKRSKTNLLNEISSQAIIFPTECLDTILGCPKAEQENGANWVMDQLNEALKTLVDEVNVRIGASFDAINEVLGAEIDALDTSYTQHVNFVHHNAVSVSDDILGIARQSLPAIGIGGLSTTLVTTLLNPIAGILTGITAGGLFLWKSHSLTNKQRRLAELKQQLAPKLTLALNELKSYVIERYDEFEEGIGSATEVMIEKINSEIQDCMDALKSCEQEAKEFESKQTLINNKMIALENHIKQLEILMTNPFENIQSN